MHCFPHNDAGFRWCTADCHWPLKTHPRHLACTRFLTTVLPAGGARLAAPKGGAREWSGSAAAPLLLAAQPLGRGSARLPGASAERCCSRWAVQKLPVPLDISKRRHRVGVWKGGRGLGSCMITRQSGAAQDGVGSASCGCLPQLNFHNEPLPFCRPQQDIRGQAIAVTHALHQV